jgi:hypothetical protein
MAAYRARVTGKRSPSEPDIKSAKKKTARRSIAGEPFSKNAMEKCRRAPGTAERACMSRDRADPTRHNCKEFGESGRLCRS